MLLKIKISGSQSKRLETLINWWFAEAEEKDYITFYNLLTTVRKLQKKNLNNHFSLKQTVSVSLNPNEYETIRLLFSELNITDPYDVALVADFSMQTDKQFLDFEARINLPPDPEDPKKVSISAGSDQKLIT